MKLPQMIRNLWIFRRLVALAVIFGLALFFVMSNREPVRVTFPLLGSIDSNSGWVMLISAALGAAASWLVLTFRFAWREARAEKQRAAEATSEARLAGHAAHGVRKEPGTTESGGAGKEAAGEDR
jgi:uncharacterized integral membrane protein